MDRIKIALNLRKPGNYAFFCPVSRLHLTRSNPVGFANGVTSAILTGLTSKSLLDVDGVVDLKTGRIKEKAADSNKEEIKTDVSEGTLKDAPTEQITDAPVDAPEAQNTEKNEEHKEEQVEEKESNSEAPKSVIEGVPETAPRKRGRKTNK